MKPDNSQNRQSRPVISSEEDALRDLGALPSQPAWQERDLSLPLNRLSWDEFEVFCFLLLRREHPSDEVVYYGKTADLGRDIVHRRADGGLDFVQCKHYSNDVTLGEIREELAKLFKNVFRGDIPEKPSRIWFYVTRDLTSPAKGLLSRDRWVEAAEQALTDHLKSPPPSDLLEFARTWWPAEGVHAEPGIALTDRAERHFDLIEKFFRIRKVIDGSKEEVSALVRKAVADEFDRRQPPPG